MHDATQDPFDRVTIPHGAALSVFTDGASIGNPGPAGSAFVIVMDGTEIVSRAFPLGRATNNIAEMTGPLEALRYLADRTDLAVTILTDSQYVAKGMTEWLAGWKRKGWLTATREPVKNRDLWEALEAEALRFPILRWSWVKGHAGHEHNERADKLALAAAEANR